MKGVENVLLPSKYAVTSMTTQRNNEFYPVEHYFSARPNNTEG